MSAIGKADATDWNPVSVVFEKVARFYPEMDFIVYLNEDCSYRAERVDAFLTVLWHPYDERLVGIKLKGFRFLFERLCAILSLDGREETFVPLVQAVELALVGGMAESMMNGISQTRVRQKYDQAREFASRENAVWKCTDEDFFAKAA